MTEIVREIWQSVPPLKFNWRSVWVLSAVIALAVLLLDPGNTELFFSKFSSALLSTLPYIVFAVLLIAAMKAAGAEGVVGKAFKGHETRSIILAALIGGLAPFCSCEVIPFIAAMLVAGVPLAPVMAFWLASPLVDPPTILITAGALGWDFAIGKTIAAVGIGLMGGFGLSAMLRAGLFADPLRTDSTVSSCGCGPDPFSQKPVWKFWQDRDRFSTFRNETLSNGEFLLKWLTLAYLIEAAMIIYVPASLIAGAVGGDSLTSIFAGAAVGMPAYLNGYAAPALLSGLIEQGMGRGAAMSFLVAGAVSSIPAMAAVFALVRKPVFATYVGFGFIGAILSGVMFQVLV